MPGDACDSIVADMAVPFVGALRGDAYSGGDLGPGGTGGQRFGDLGLPGGGEFFSLRAELGDAFEMTVTRNHPSTVVDGVVRGRAARPRGRYPSPRG